LSKNRLIIMSTRDFKLTPLYAENFPFLIFYSFKAGSSSIIKWFLFQIGKFEEGKTAIHQYLYGNYFLQQDYRNKLLKEMFTGNKQWLKVVRNPYMRAVSSFLHVLKYQNIIDNNQKRGCSFKEFLYYLKKLNIKTVDQLFRQQYLQNEEKYMKYIHLEKFSDEIRLLEQKYQLPTSPLEEITYTWHHNADKMGIEGDFANKTLTKESFKHPLPTYNSFYDEENLRLVKEIYKDDFIYYPNL